MAFLAAIQWDHPGIVGPVAVAVTAGCFKIVSTIIARKKSRDDGSTNIATTVKVGLDEHGVRRALKEELSKQLAQLAPRQPVPDSGDPLKIKAVEFLNAGVDAYDSGEIGEARGHWLDAIDLDPGYAAAHNNLGVVLKAKGDLDAAIEHYNTALRIDSDYADAHNNLGNALRAKGDPDAAIEHYNAALQIDPDHASAHFNLGCAFALKKDAATSVAALAKAIELDSKHRDKAKSDTDYDPIRDDSAFRKLVYGE